MSTLAKATVRHEPPKGGGAAFLLSVLAVGMWALTPSSVTAQALRGWVGTNVQAVQMRPLVLDTIPASALELQPDGTYLYQGQSVSCAVVDLCTVYGTADPAIAWAATEDVSFTAWGFGVQGLSFTTLLRGRSDLGSELIWPRTNDRFEAMLAYAQLVRGPFRVRAGRQEIRGGLGFPAFDGASGVYTHGSLGIEAYVGRSLARGLREPANTALQGLDPYLVDQSSYLYGGSVRGRVSAATFTARYQRELLSDRSGLVSDRGSFDFATPVPRGRLSGSLDYDFAMRRTGKGNLTLGVPFDQGHWLVELVGRRYLPYFDLSTIWGFFEPVSYSEGELRTSWSPAGSFGAWVSGGYRSYGDTHTTVILQPLTGDGWRANGGIRWLPSEAWSVDGGYRLEWGPGGFMQSGDAALRYAPSDAWGITASGQTFQQVEEFRVGDGRAVGGGMSFDLGFGERARLTGGIMMLRHRDGGTTTLSPWNQTRGWTSLRINVGEDPGLANRRGS
jgi:hypothetical protein